jgi:hypothetical protein
MPDHARTPDAAALQGEVLAAIAAVDDRLQVGHAPFATVYL